MPYIPKSQYEIKHTNGGEFYVISTGKEYRGEYIQYRNKYFAGNTTTNLKTRLKKIDLGSGTVDKNTRNFLYNQLKDSYYKKVKNFKRPPASAPQPTKEDYDKGVWERYFTQRANDQNQIFEISKDVYTDLKSGKYNPYLYKFSKLEWSLTSSDVNLDRVLKQTREYPTIGFLFNNPGEFIK